jgi:hypothetical protein
MRIDLPLKGRAVLEKRPCQENVQNLCLLMPRLRIIASEMPERPKSAVRRRQSRKNFFRRRPNRLVSFSVTIGDAAR